MNLFLGDCKPSEVKAFTADYLEKVLEPCDWLAVWSTDVFSVLVEVSLVFFRHKEQLSIAGTTDNFWSHDCQRPKSPNKKKCTVVTGNSSVIWCDVWYDVVVLQQMVYFKFLNFFYYKKCCTLHS